MNLQNLKLMAYEIENKLFKEFEEVNDYIFKNPELGGQEYNSSE